MTDIEDCRCGTELLMGHGAATRCPHCDTVCPHRASTCPRCIQLLCTCNDCGTPHCNPKAANRCEMSHPIPRLT